MNRRFAIALPLTYYILITLDNAIHELGHLLVTHLVRAQPVGLFIAPAVVGYARWNYGAVPEGSIKSADIWITAGGVLTELIVGILLLAIVWAFRNRLRGWSGLVLVLSSLILLSMGAFYFLFSWIVDWGDGAELVRHGLNPLFLILFVVAIITCIAIVGTPLIVRSMAAYTPLFNFRTIWFCLIIMGVPVQLYGAIKSYLFFPDESLVNLYTFLAYVLISAILAAAMVILGKAALAKPSSQRSTPSNVTLICLILIALVIEIGCTLYFGFGNDMHYLWFI